MEMLLIRFFFIRSRGDPVIKLSYSSSFWFAGKFIVLCVRGASDAPAFGQKAGEAVIIARHDDIEITMG